MLTRILHNSEKLCIFLDQLDPQLSQPQRRHILNMADALLVCEDKKTLAALQRQMVEAPDASNMADFLRISPWQAKEARGALRAHQVAWLVAASILEMQTRQYTGAELGATARDLSLNLVVQVFAIIAMRSIGLFHRHYSCYFRW